MLLLSLSQIRAVSVAVNSYQVSLEPNHLHERACKETVETLEHIYNQYVPKTIQEVKHYEPITYLFYSQMIDIIIEEDIRLHREHRGRLAAFLAEDFESIIKIYREYLDEDELSFVTHTPYRAIKFRNGNEVRFFNPDRLPVNLFNGSRWSNIYRLIYTKGEQR